MTFRSKHATITAHDEPLGAKTWAVSRAPGSRIVFTARAHVAQHDRFGFGVLLVSGKKASGWIVWPDTSLTAESATALYLERHEVAS